jgi:4-amino-4-deoxy-L-arabinose transferase-like glycosyltransferase
MNGIKRSLVVGAALLLYWVMAVSVSPRMGVTGDEVVHITGGYSYWTLNDYRLHPENGNLAQRVATLPLIGMELAFPSLEDPDWLNAKVNLVGEKFFFQEGNPVNLMLLGSRMMIAFAGAFTVWLAWRWAAGLFGSLAGWVTLGLSVFCPALLAHGGLATSDMVMTACVLGALTAVWQLFHRVTVWRIVLAAVACGLAFLSKMSGVIIVPLILGMLMIRCLRRTPLVLQLKGTQWIRSRTGVAITVSGLAVLIALGSLMTLWAGFGFRYSGFNPTLKTTGEYYLPWEVVLSRESLPPPTDTSLDNLRIHYPPPQPTRLDRLIEGMRNSKLLPEAYLWGFAQTHRFSRERPAFFMGEHRNHGWAAFFPVAFALKTPPPALLLGLAGIIALFTSVITRNKTASFPRAWAYKAVPLLLFFGAYWFLALRMNLNIGHRHILPTYPVFYVFAGAAVLWLRTKARRVITGALIALLALHTTESLLARPFYLSYFHSFAGGSGHNHRYLVDSSLDWGQGLPDLKTWLAVKALRQDRAPVFLSYFGADSPRARNLEVIRFGDEINDRGPRTFPAQLRAGWYVISATNFVQAYAPTRGPWTTRHENTYQQILDRLRTTKDQNSADASSQRRHLQDCMDMELLQAARLFTYLQNRRPLEVIGDSLLIFKLESNEVTTALYGPPPL